MSAVHEAASVGFGRAADAYERGRPEYSPEAVDLVRTKLSEFRDSFRRISSSEKTSGTGLVAEGLMVADVAAGTGKFTKVLASFPERLVAKISAVEPVAAMRAKCEQFATSRMEVLDGTAEKQPFADGSLDVMLDRVASVSFVAALDEADRTTLPTKMRELYLRPIPDSADPAARAGIQIAMPYEAQIFICHRN